MSLYICNQDPLLTYNIWCTRLLQGTLDLKYLTEKQLLQIHLWIFKF